MLQDKPLPVYLDKKVSSLYGLLMSTVPSISDGQVCGPTTLRSYDFGPGPGPRILGLVRDSA